jgi:hypothetical protein
MRSNTISSRRKEGMTSREEKEIEVPVTKSNRFTCGEENVVTPMITFVYIYVYTRTLFILLFFSIATHIELSI